MEQNIFLYYIYQVHEENNFAICELSEPMSQIEWIEIGDWIYYPT